MATVEQLTAAVAERGNACLCEGPLSGLCQVLACSHTAVLWLKTMMAHPSAAGTKGVARFVLHYSMCALLEARVLDIGFSWEAGGLQFCCTFDSC